MKVGEPVKTKQNHCLECGKLVDGATAVGVDGVVSPKPGDATICFYCGHLMMFDKHLRFRALTDAEMRECAGDARIVAINRVRGSKL